MGTGTESGLRGSQWTLDHGGRPVAGVERRDAARNREAILVAAGKLFAENGVTCVTMEEISRSAGVGKGTLYRRFPNKGLLCQALLDAPTRGFQQETLEVLGGSRRRAAGEAGPVPRPAGRLYRGEPRPPLRGLRAAFGGRASRLPLASGLRLAAVDRARALEIRRPERRAFPGPRRGVLGRSAHRPAGYRPLLPPAPDAGYPGGPHQRWPPVPALPGPGSSVRYKNKHKLSTENEKRRTVWHSVCW